MISSAAYPVHALIENQHVSLGIHHHDPVHRARDDLFKKRVGFLHLPFKADPRRHIPGSLQELSHLAPVVINGGDGYHVEAGFSRFVFVFLIGADQAFLLHLLQTLGHETGPAVFVAGLVQAVSDFIAAPAYHVIVLEALIIEESLIHRIDSHVQTHHHDAVGQGIENDLGLPPGPVHERLLLPGELGVIYFYLDEVPEKPCGLVVNDGYPGRSFLVDRVAKGRGTGQLDDQTQAFQAEKLVQVRGGKEFEQPCIAKAQGIRVDVGNAQDIQFQS